MKTEKIIEMLMRVAMDMQPAYKARIASAVVHRGKIISIGINQDKTHPFAAEYSKHPAAIFLHAEADAILKARKRLSERELQRSTIFVVRVKEDLDGEYSFGIAKPCSGCEKCIKDHGIRRVIFTNNSSGLNLSYTVEL